MTPGKQMVCLRKVSAEHRILNVSVGWLVGTIKEEVKCTDLDIRQAIQVDVPAIAF